MVHIFSGNCTSGTKASTGKYVVTCIYIFAALCGHILVTHAYRESIFNREIADSRTYVRHFHTGNGIFHCDSGKCDLML